VGSSSQAITHLPQNIWSGGLPRTYQVSVPSSYTGAPLPLVFMLHPGGGALGFAQASGMVAKGEAQGFFVVSLLGMECDSSAGDPNCTYQNGAWTRGWNSGIAPGMAIVADDVQFVRDVLHKLQFFDHWHIDTSRVYAAGMSNGGMMAHRLAAEMPDQLAAVGIVSSTIGLQYHCSPTCDVSLGYSCDWGTTCATYKVGTSTPPASGPIPVMIVHGSADDHIWWDGSVGVPPPAGPGIDPIPHQASINFWVNTNACAGSPQVVINGAVKKTTYSSCDLDADVVSYFIEEMHHVWQTSSFPTTDALWAFFQAHTL
jgi:polyhydroxybutyrate depolymerase